MQVQQSRYSTEPEERVYVKGYSFLSLTKNICKKYANKIANRATQQIK